MGCLEEIKKENKNKKAIDEKNEVTEVTSTTPGVNLPEYKEKTCNFSVTSKLPQELQNLTWEQLFREVGAKIVYEDKKPVLRFNPPLDGPKVDPERWEKALKLEECFWKKVNDAKR